MRTIKKKIDIICPICNKTFKAYPSEHRIYCSSKCSSTNRTPWNKDKGIDSYCLNCKNYIRKGDGHLYKFCTHKCAGAYYKGKNNPRWKEDKKRKLNNLIRRTYEYKQWRSDVYSRDKWTCQTCNYRGSNLNAHHIVELVNIIRKYNIKTLEDALICKELWDIDNGVTLCEDCHNLTKHGRGR